MDNTVIIAGISFLGTVSGSLLGIIAANKLVNYRLEKLEEKVAKHNNLIERMYKVEDRASSNTHRIDSIEERIEKKL